MLEGTLIRVMVALSVIIRAASDALGSTLTDMCGVVISEHFRAKSCNLKNLSPIKNLY